MKEGELIGYVFNHNGVTFADSGKVIAINDDNYLIVESNGQRWRVHKEQTFSLKEQNGSRD